MNNITLSQKNYATEEEFFNAISTAVKLLLQAGYIMTVRYDEPGLGIVCIEFENEDRRMGAPYPYWLTNEEQELVDDYRYHNEDVE